MEMLFKNIFFNIFALVAAFALLFKSADFFVDSSVGIAGYLGLPKMIVGIVLVGFATTAPEIAVSVQSAYLGYPELAFGNAIGSVICDDGVALALAAVVAPVAISIDKKILRTAGLFLIFIDLLAYILSLNGRIGRIEGAILVTLLIGYVLFVIFNELRKRGNTGRNTAVDRNETEEAESESGELTDTASGMSVKEKTGGSSKRKLKKHILLFITAMAGVIITSRIAVWSAVNIAKFFNASEIIIGLTIVAIGTSLPEISTAVTAALKGEGEIAAGDIIGADILNILWIIGVSSMVRPIQLDTRIVHFSFLWMFLIVGTMLVSMRIGFKLGKLSGFILLAMYIGYIFTNIKFFY
jgi:cation:H+ antiporter